MCIAVPVRLTKITEKTGLVELGGIYQEVNIELVNDLKVGDYVLVHSGCALQKINQIEAEKTLNLLNKLSGDIDEIF